MGKAPKPVSPWKAKATGDSPREFSRNEPGRGRIEKLIDAADDDIGMDIKVAKDAGREIIYFKSAKNPTYGCFSNMKASNFTVRGLQYRSTEHFYHSEKFRLGAEFAAGEGMKAELREIAEAIRTDTTDAKKAGENNTEPVRGTLQAKKYAKKRDGKLPDGFLTNEWADKGLKGKVMKEGLLAKFREEGNEKFRETLLGTGDAYIVQLIEACNFFGWHPKTGGGNELGKLLMAVREELRNNEDGKDDNVRKAKQVRKNKATKEARLKQAVAVLQGNEMAKSGEEEDLMDVESESMSF